MPIIKIIQHKQLLLNFGQLLMGAGLEASLSHQVLIHLLLGCLLLLLLLLNLTLNFTLIHALFADAGHIGIATGHVRLILSLVSSGIRHFN